MKQESTVGGEKGRYQSAHTVFSECGVITSLECEARMRHIQPARGKRDNG